MDYDQIMSTLQDAENTVTTLKKMIEEQKAGTGATSSRSNQSNQGSRTGTGHSSAGEAQGVFSKDEMWYTKYMTLSTVKLFDQRGEEVFRIQDSVGLYFIVPGSPVRTAARSSLLRIVRIAEEFQDSSHPPAFVQVGDWVYPLMPGSMVYRSQQKYYLFPDLTSTTPGSSVGVVLPKSCPPENKTKFEMLILGYLNMLEFPPQPDSFGKSTDLILSARTSVKLVRTKSGIYSERNSVTSLTDDVQNGKRYGKRIGQGVKAGGELLAHGFQLGAKGTAYALTSGAGWFMSVTLKEENDKDIPELVVDGVSYAKDVTGRVVELSATILDTVTGITSNLATLTACWIRSASEPFLRSCVDCVGMSQETADAIAAEMKDAGNGIVGGIAEAITGFERAAKILAESLNDNAVDVVTHCYGPSAASVLTGAGNVLGHIAMTGRNTGQAVRVGKHLKDTMKKTGLALALEDCKKNS